MPLLPEVIEENAANFVGGMHRRIDPILRFISGLAGNRQHYGARTGGIARAADQYLGFFAAEQGVGGATNQ
jgi:hypothetical protein